MGQISPHSFGNLIFTEIPLGPAPSLQPGLLPPACAAAAAASAVAACLSLLQHPASRSCFFIRQ